jgi:hypothetical protein
MNFLRFTLVSAVVLSVSMWSVCLAAHDFIVTRHFSGLWDQPEQESQGISLQIVHQDNGSPSAVAYWFTYGADLETAWFLGVGELVDERIEMDLFKASGVGFMQPDAPGDASVENIGTMLITFETCDHGTVTFESTLESVGSGSFPIERLTWIHNTNCSGGISDDHFADAMHGEERINLVPARGGISGSGHAEYERSAGYARFDVEIEDMPDGNYHLFVGSHNRGAFMVAGGRGEIDFRSPGEDGKHLMTFDPRGMSIEIHDGQGLALSGGDSMFGDDDDHGHGFNCDFDGGHGGGMGGGHGGGMGGGHGGGHDDDCPEEGEFFEIEIDFTNTGVIPAASGDAELELTHGHAEFKVEIEDVPAGFYPLTMGGEQVGIIGAVEQDGKVSGELEFRDPQRVGTLPLEFDPRGQHIEVLQGSQVILEVDFPEE